MLKFMERSHLKMLRIFLMLWIIIVSSSAIAKPILVTDFRVGLIEKGTVTRVVIELNSRLSFEVFALTKPDRIVIDLPEVGWSLPPHPLPKNMGVFNRVRYGLKEPGLSRIVLDLSKRAKIKKSFIFSEINKKKWRLTIDLVGAVNLNNELNPLPIKEVGVKRSALEAMVERAEKTELTRPNYKKRFESARRKPKLDVYTDKKIIVIDSGHGGTDPGAIGKSGIYEKHITLAMAQELAKILETSGQFVTKLTRDRDVYISLRDRVKISRRYGADLFISLHADSVKNRRISGPSVYTLSERASDKVAEQLAEEENKADLIMGFDLSPFDANVKNIFIDLTRRESMNQSAVLATNLVQELRKKVKVLRNTHRFAGFAVLKALDVPSVLIEMGFLSNSSDEKALRSKKYRKELASAIASGIESYFSRVKEARNY